MRTVLRTITITAAFGYGVFCGLGIAILWSLR